MVYLTEVYRDKKKILNIKGMTVSQHINKTFL